MSNFTFKSLERINFKKVEIDYLAYQILLHTIRYCKIRKVRYRISSHLAHGKTFKDLNSSTYNVFFLSKFDYIKTKDFCQMKVTTDKCNKQINN